ncbi:MAG: hypothetical protein ACE5J2_08785 [Nitrososphaerales archaeon]
MQRVLLVSSLIIILLSATVTNANLLDAESDTALSSERKPKDVIINAKMQINLVLIGDTWSGQDKGNITVKLLKTYSPTIFFENRTAGVTYNYTYNFDSVSEEIADELFKFIDSIAVENTTPQPIKEWVDTKELEFWGPEFVNITKKKYKMISAYQVEDWLFDNLEPKEGYTIYFLKPSNSQINYFHTYGSVTRDPDTGRDFIQEGMMGFGGTNRFYFIDLTAGPWLYPYVPISEDQVIAQFHKNLYDVKTDEDYYEFIAGYVNHAIMLLFNPSYIYSPIYKSNFRIDVFLVDMTSGRAFYDVASKFIDRSTVNHALTQLIPYAEWSSEINGQSFDSLPRELQRTILRSLSFNKVQGGDVVVVKSEDLILELNKWVASTLTQEQLQLAQEEAARTVFVPVVIFVFDTDAYVDKIPVVGTAAPDPNDGTVPCCAIVAVDKHALFDIGTGLSTLTVHEMGHVLGLRHPHDGHNPAIGEFNDWFFDWTHTAMSYISPTGLGCGLPNVPCGLVVSEFGKFDHDAMDRALVLYLLNQVQLNVYDSTISLESKGYKLAMPDDIRSLLSNIDLDVQMSIEHFANMNYFNHTSFKSMAKFMDPMDDSFDFALKALKNSEQLLQDVSSLDYATPKGASTIVASDPFFVDEYDNELISLEVGEVIGIKSAISSNANEDINFTYLVQIKDSNDFTLFLISLDGITVKPEEVIEPSIFWISDTAGELEIEVFVWQSINNPVPLSQVKDRTVTVTK